MVNPNAGIDPTGNASTTPATQPSNDLSQKLLLLIRNAGAPQMVKDSLIAEVENKGPSAEVMDKIIQAFQTEKDILNLTINSIENLKKQVAGSPAQLVQEPPVQMQPTEVITAQVSPPPTSTEAPTDQMVAQPVQQPQQLQQPQQQADDKELENLLDELKQIQSQPGQQQQ